jgi:ubiquinone/menaquinone biosynthesis C-methylase UbiE
MPDETVPQWDRDIVATYDAVAEEYASHFFDELSKKPFDCSLLTKFAQAMPEGGRVCDMGCGPGHIARFLSERGANVLGVDVSPAMVEVAGRLNPELTFEQGDMLCLQFPDGSFAGITAFYSLIHIERSRVAQALAELFRVLTPGGRLLCSFHVGEGEVHPQEFLGQSVPFHATFFSVEETAANLAAAGFVIEETPSRAPYGFEYPSQRAYLLVRKPWSIR